MVVGETRGCGCRDKKEGGKTPNCDQLSPGLNDWISRQHIFSFFGSSHFATTAISLTLKARTLQLGSKGRTLVSCLRRCLWCVHLFGVWRPATGSFELRFWSLFGVCSCRCRGCEGQKICFLGDRLPLRVSHYVALPFSSHSHTYAGTHTQKEKENHEPTTTPPTAPPHRS